MSSDPKKISLYCQGTFDKKNPTPSEIDQMIAAAADINKSGFGTVLLGQWHVHSDGSVYYNDSPLDSVIQALKVIPTALKTGGSVDKVLISFGPFGSDFQGIKDNLMQFKKTMAGVLAVTDIDGFDWDLEQDYSQFTDLLVDLTQWTNGLGKMVTAAPYEEMSFWQSVLKRTNTGGNAGFAWWNLQLYSGITNYTSWEQGLQGMVPNPQAFLLPGYKIQTGTTPASVTADIQSLRNTYPNIDGAFIWQYENLIASGATASQYATAISNGLTAGAKKVKSKAEQY